MKPPKELINGILIFIGTSFYYLLMDILGLSDLFYLRFLSVFFIYYGINRTIKMNLAQGKRNLASDAGSALTTGFIGVALSILGIIIFAYLNGGDSYVSSLPKTFFLGGDPSLMTYSISLLIEGISFVVIITMLLLFYWNNRLTTD
ncbi:hypothetical protein [Flavobacterium degerlachei]|jgi:hypothetical protein|uniref:Uncharacterized protein n=1 Tax=Flavobacterium degerlachei TaxID=229203 RepID=A0A1H2Q7D6_9FLAO|nr:hypothetical protein [Flavobacterium degerlachei]SDW02688.1 hypothetical protein SAMN05444338_101106 [Flavobacterium degerlachei]